MPINVRFDWSYLLLLPYLVASYIPWVGQRVRFRYYALFTILWFGLALVRQRNVHLPKRGLASLAWAVLLFTTYDLLGLLFLPFGHGNGVTITDVFDIVRLFVPLGILHYSVRNGRLRELGMLVILVLMCLACTAVITWSIGTEVENASRMLTGKSSEYNANWMDVDYALKNGVGQFAHVYGFGLLALPLMYCSKYMSLWAKVLCRIVATIFLLSAYFASYFILILAILTGFGVWLALASSGSSKRRWVKTVGTLFVVLAITVMINPSIFRGAVPTLLAVRDMTENKEYRMKITAVIDAVSGSSDSYCFYRKDLYERSWNAFLENPLVGFGVWDYIRAIESSDIEKAESVGGHSQVLDTLGRSGLFGFSIFILGFVFLFRYLRAISSQFLGFRWWPTLYIFMFQAILVSFLNPLRGYTVYTDLLLLIPGMACLFKESAAEARRNSTGLGVSRASGVAGFYADERFRCG